MAFVTGKGGVSKTTVAAALALATARPAVVELPFLGVAALGPSELRALSTALAPAAA